ncbi:thiolase-like protein [Xylariomycetidae sp. FL2044]|nr:thiolase-like protein [Xylariomycetidae sp. FL2044]
MRKTTKHGYFLERVEDFDLAFFGISPKEAEQMNPPQRLSLEVAWEALEDAGIDPKSLSRSDTAVFMGVNSEDYRKLLLEDSPNVNAWTGIGTASCGSKVVITGGVNVLCVPGLTRVLDKAGALSPDGNCLSFDNRAHGYRRGEGAAVVAQEGRTNGIMAPNPNAQELVARQALQQAKVNLSTIEYVEAHATSTLLEGPMKLAPVAIGSMKPNVGQLEAGAGAVGFINGVMAMIYGPYPPQANLNKLNSRIDWEKSATRVVREASIWHRRIRHPRRAAICSNGSGRTISHTIIEPSGFRASVPYEFQQVKPSDSATGPVLFVISAPQEKRRNQRSRDKGSESGHRHCFPHLQTILGDVPTRGTF